MPTIGVEPGVRLGPGKDAGCPGVPELQAAHSNSSIINSNSLARCIQPLSFRLISTTPGITYQDDNMMTKKMRKVHAAVMSPDYTVATVVDATSKASFSMIIIVFYPVVLKGIRMQVSSTSQNAPVTRRWAQNLYLALASLILLGIFLQGFLIGAFLFAGATWGRNAHSVTGLVLLILSLLLALEGLLA